METKKYRSIESEMINFFPGSKSGEAVEIGQESLWVEFGGFFQPGGVEVPKIIPCADGPTMAMCASTTIESETGIKSSTTRMRCWNASSIHVQTNNEIGSLRLNVELGNEAKIIDFDATTTVVVEEGVFCSSPINIHNNTIIAKNALATFSFRTVSAPEVPDGAKTANTTVTTKKYQVYGLGVFMNDVATIDVSAGTFYGDVSIYLLRYYRTFVDAKTALEEATVTSSFGRECAMSSDSSTEKWLLLKKSTTTENAMPNDENMNEGQQIFKKKSDKGIKKNTAAALAAGPDADDDVVTVSDEGRFVILVNAGKFPKVEVEYRADDFDHVRVRTEFYFEPTLRSYPFQRQTLPVTLELASDVLRQTPSKLLCLLTPYSGFAPKLSSFSAAENEDNVLSASTLVDEAPRAPPFPSCGRAQFRVVREEIGVKNNLRGRNTLTESIENNLTPNDATPNDATIPQQDGKLKIDQQGTTQNQELAFLKNKNPCSPKRSTSRLSLNLVYEPPTRVGAMILLPSGLIGAGALVSYALADPVSRLQTLATSLLAAVVQHASIRSALPPRSVVTTADEFAFSVYAVVAVATAASFFVALDNTQRARNLAACAGAASIVFFLHAKQPAGLDLDWSPALLAFILVFCLLASLVHPEFVLGICGLRLAVVQSTARGLTASNKNRSGIFNVASGIFSPSSTKHYATEETLPSPRNAIDASRGVRHRTGARRPTTRHQREYKDKHSPSPPSEDQQFDDHDSGASLLLLPTEDANSENTSILFRSSRYTSDQQISAPSVSSGGS